VTDRAANYHLAHRQRYELGAVEGADRRDQARIRRSVDRAFESGERLAKLIQPPWLVLVARAFAHHPKERVCNPTDGAPINLSNALWQVRAPKPRVSL
jgi:hypothetical protein